MICGPHSKKNKSKARIPKAKTDQGCITCSLLWLLYLLLLDCSMYMVHNAERSRKITEIFLHQVPILYGDCSVVDANSRYSAILETLDKLSWQLCGKLGLLVLGCLLYSFKIGKINHQKEMSNNRTFYANFMLSKQFFVHA